MLNYQCLRVFVEFCIRVNHTHNHSQFTVNPQANHSLLTTIEEKKEGKNMNIYIMCNVHINMTI